MKNRKNDRPASRISDGSIMAILVAILPFVMLFMMMNPGRAGEYNRYNGPILPLSSLSGGECLTVERDVTLDFAPYLREKEYDFDPNWVAVTDRYVLTNPTRENVTVELVWGFQGRFTDPRQSFPQITVDGESAVGTLYAALDSDSEVFHAYRFEKMKEVLTRHDYLAEAMAEVPEWNRPVKVYRFHNAAYEGDLPYLPRVDIAFNYGENTELYPYGESYSFSYDEENQINHINYDIGDELVFLVAGDDIADLAVGGALSYTVGSYQGTPVEGVTCDVEIYETTFADWLWEFVQEYQYPYGEENTALELLTPQLYFEGVIRQLAAAETQMGAFDPNIINLLGNVAEDSRMLYWVFPVEIPAGASVEVVGCYEKQSSYNSNDTRHGYDIATTLGSNLNFTGLTARLENSQLVILELDEKEQNFGFDLHRGILEVEMDVSTERYFLGILMEYTENTKNTE